MGFNSAFKGLKWLCNKEIALLKVSNRYTANVENIVSY